MRMESGSVVGSDGAGMGCMSERERDTVYVCMGKGSYMIFLALMENKHTNNSCTITKMSSR